MNIFEKTLQKYDYNFPAELVATAPVSPRDSAKILVFDRKTKKVRHDTFKNLADYLPDNAVLVLNNTKVIPARIIVEKPTGGKLELLYIKHDSQLVYGLLNKSVEVGTILTLPDKKTLVVTDKKGSVYSLKPNFSAKNILVLLNKAGTMPPLLIFGIPNSKKAKFKRNTKQCLQKHLGQLLLLRQVFTLPKHC